MTANTKSSTDSLCVRPHRLPSVRMIQNYHLVWLDGSTDETNENHRNYITKLKELVYTVNTFVDVNECVDFITDFEEKAFVIVSGEFLLDVVSIIQDISQVQYVYIFYENNVSHKKWTKQWPKVAGVYTDMTSIYEALKKAMRDCDHNSISISFIKKTDETANQSFDTLDCAFMYTQILKEILLTINFDQGHIKEFLTYSREQLANNSGELKNIDKIKNEYHCHKPIWWYTYHCFLYSMLSRALCKMEVDVIIKMGFFLRDLHNHIAELHTQQYVGNHLADPFTVYRGQSMPSTDFNQMKMMRDGLLTLHNFLSTSYNRNVALRLAQRAINSSDLVGVLLVIKIDPAISTTPFADIKIDSYYQREEGILFSIHSVFRIGQIKQIETNDRLWQAELTLIGDNDAQLQALTKSIPEDIQGSTGWFRLGLLMVKLAQLNQAQQVFELILGQTSDEKEKSDIYNCLGCIKHNQEKHEEALLYHRNALEIRQQTLSTNHPDLAVSFNDIGSVYYDMGEYSKALSYSERALNIFEHSLPSNHRLLKITKNNIEIIKKKL